MTKAQVIDLYKTANECLMESEDINEMMSLSKSIREYEHYLQVVFQMTVSQIEALI